MTRSESLSTVRNAARVLKAFRDGGPSLGVSELARRLGLGKSTVHRLLATLAGEGLVAHDQETGMYRLGLALYELGALVPAHLALHEAATPVIEALRYNTRETVQVSVLDGREVVYVERLESSYTLRIMGRVGHRMPAYCSSSGKVLLAFLSDERLNTLLADWALTPLTPQTITDGERLRSELHRIRARGFAENVNESEPGAASVAAPIRGIGGDVVAAVGVVGPTTRLDAQTMPRIAHAVVEAAGRISGRLTSAAAVRS